MRKLALTILAGAALAGCGTVQNLEKQGAVKQSTPAPQTVLRAHPQAVEPVAGAGAAAPAGSAAPASVSVTGGSSSGALAQPISIAQVRRQLRQSGLNANQNVATLTPDGLAIPPASAPQAVQEVIAAGNEIAHLPYRFGGGHGTFVDTAYDCSGSLSFAFAAAGLLNTTLASGGLETWGKAGKGKWITVFANAGHTFMYVAGLRFDTVALAQTGSRWSNRPAGESGSYAVRHPGGL